MRSICLAGAAGLAAIAGCTEVNTVRLGNSVLCGPTEVIMPSQAVTSLVALVGEADYGREVCAAAAGINATGIVEPTRATLALPTGDVIVRVRENTRG
jgi:drug/metabolite transporter superfamily protein YnfA